MALHEHALPVQNLKGIAFVKRPQLSRKKREAATPSKEDSPELAALQARVELGEALTPDERRRLDAFRRERGVDPKEFASLEATKVEPGTLAWQLKPQARLPVCW